MSRLPPRPDLAWNEDGTPVDQRVGDVYFSRADGLAESRSVFLAGCGLPEAWGEERDFTIGELGFGTGLNFLAAWQLWQATRPRKGWLHFVSFEGFPLDPEDAERALAAWPELAPLAAKLSAVWPQRAKGVQTAVWAQARVTLTLHIGDISETLPETQFKADAWFLDGFSPAKNEAMWVDTLWTLMAERSHPRARAATFTVAGAVRRGLTAAGFQVEKKPGYGRKRERLEAVFQSGSPIPRAAPQVPKVAIIGAGISGACLAKVLIQRGAKVTVFDQSPGPAEGTSGNPLALMMPRLDAGDTPEARLLVEAYISAQRFYKELPGVECTSVEQRPRDETEAERFAKVLADTPLGLEQCEALRGGGLLHKRALIIRPRALLSDLLKDTEVRWGTRAELDIESRKVSGEPFDAVIVANGWQMGEMDSDLQLTGRLGQLEYFQTDAMAPPSAIAAGHYALASGLDRLWGATFEAHQCEPPQISAEARARNIKALEALNPYWRQATRKADIQSRAGIRATTADRLPLIGHWPESAVLNAMARTLERRAWSLRFDEAARDGLYLAGGYGSRGFTWAPWAAQLLTAMIFDDPIPTRVEALQAVMPARQLLRAIKRGELRQST